MIAFRYFPGVSGGCPGRAMPLPSFPPYPRAFAEASGAVAYDGILPLMGGGLHAMEHDGARGLRDILQWPAMARDGTWGLRDLMQWPEMAHYGTRWQAGIT